MIAGAGSGKTSVMAARVVYLVATGQVTPDQVLGLTFTTKAASELAPPDPGRARRRRLGPPAPRSDDADEVLEPIVATYNAYAASLLTEHGLRIGHEPDTRVMADASRYQLAARVIDRHTGRVDLLSDSPKHVIDYILAARGGDERAPGRLPTSCAPSTPASGRCSPRAWRPRRRTYGQGRECVRPPGGGARRWSDEYRALKATLGLMDFSDQIALGRPAGRRATRWSGELEREKYRVVLLDEYQDTSVAQAHDASPTLRPGGAPGHRRRRPQPGDLRLARRVGLQHPALRRRLPGGRRRRRSAATR